MSELARETVALINPPISFEAAQAELSAIEQELRRRRWAADPDVWAREKLGDVLWSGQRRILQSVRDHRKTAVATCHEVGKSYDAGILAAWWINTHKPGEAFVVTTAPTNPQVRVILWREIGRAHSRGNLLGRVNQTEWKISINGKEETVAIGRKPSDYSSTALQGIHAPFVLIIVDEASGVRGALWDALDSLMANDGSKSLEIGNPEDPSGEFHEHCRPGSGYSVIHISAFDTPNFTGEELPDSIKRQLIGRIYVEERRRKWAPRWQWNEAGTCVEPPLNAHGEPETDSAMPSWYSRVLGQFPPQGSADRALIPLAWIDAAVERHLIPTGDSLLGVDVGAGGDESTGCHLQGDVARILWSDRNPDTMQTCGNVARALRTTQSSSAAIDMIGIGRGVLDRGKELGLPFVGFNSSMKPTTEEAQEEFANFRAQSGWILRQRFEHGNIDIDSTDDDLIEELRALRFKVTSHGKIILESKDEIKKRIGRSPNRADALMIACAPRIVEEEDALAGCVVW